MLNSSFWPGVCAFAGVLFAAIAIIDFGVYIAARYRERYLQEARTELDDVLIQIPAARVLDISIAFSACGVVVSALILSFSAEKISAQTLLIVSLSAACVMFPIPRFILRYLKIRRLNKFSTQLEDALNMISGALKAGFSINQALEEVADQDIHPLSVEFRLLTQEIRRWRICPGAWNQRTLNWFQLLFPPREKPVVNLPVHFRVSPPSSGSGFGSRRRCGPLPPWAECRRS